MKLYIAAHSQSAARELKTLIESAGHTVTSRWITNDSKFGHGLSVYSDSERVALAVQDEEDVRAASDGLILIAEGEGLLVPGGKHVETGIAIALQRPVFVVGRRENVFHWHPLVRVMAGANELLIHLDSLRGN